MAHLRARNSRLCAVYLITCLVESLAGVCDYLKFVLLLLVQRGSKVSPTDITMQDEGLGLSAIPTIGSAVSALIRTKHCSYLLRRVWYK